MSTSNILPKYYNLFLDIDEKNLKYIGKVEIDLEIKNTTDKIILNSKNLKIKKVFVNGYNAVFEVNDENEILEIKLVKFITGLAKILIDFEGEIRNDLTGIYVSKVNESENMITTQFEPNYARRCFPCFDEPKLKAVFKLSLLINKDLKAISNMPIEEEKILDNKKLVIFQNTPLMSTYLLYIGIGNFDFLEKGRLRIVATKKMANLGKASLDFTEKCLSFFEEYTGIKYPLPKLDLIAVPDFGAGAMENWGAITFREVLLLFDENNVSEELKVRAFLIIAHELWHQWSGNLVTMEWWDDLWLNESFATYMAYKALETLYPSLNIDEYFVFRETWEALIRDSLKNTHPIKVEVKNINEMEEIFDEISYNKGGSVLRMVEDFIGKENFRNAIKNFLNDFAYKNANSDELFNYFEKYSNKEVKRIIESWIKKDGCPFLEVKSKKNSIKIRQKRLCLKSRDNFKWPIPLKFLLNNEEKEILLDKEIETIETKEKINYVIFNPNLTSFLRVLYSKKLLDRIKPLIFKKEIKPITRFSLLSDLFAFTKIGKISLQNYLNFLNSFELEDNWLVLYAIAYSIFELEKILGYEKNIRKIAINIFENNLKRVGFFVKSSDSLNEKLVRKISTTYLGYSNNKEVVKKSFEVFSDFPKINKDILSQVSFVVSMYGGEKEFNKFLEVYKSSNDPELKVVSVASIANFREEKIILDILNDIENKLRMQDLRIFFSNFSTNPKSGIILDWVINNRAFIKKIESSFFVLRDFLECLILSSPFDREKELFETIKTVGKKYKITINYLLEIRSINKSFWEKNKNFVIE
ncbi:MAG: M1 family metallopeptidase [Candidatus Aenigmarchaeota archaeon]|nr:M1 family metallopeptidase [Candidatus Aenigmarchaeota archaeon]MDW8149642.1 M1 family metallopeptidase [Candidatus Aenigmarchaeota archaeon]